MENYIAIAVLLLIVGFAIFYVIRAKKKGKKCIGCPDGCCPSKAKKGEQSACCCCGDKTEK